MLTAKDMAEMEQDTGRPASGRTEPGRSVTGSARPAESAPLDGGWPGYPMADYRSPSGSFGVSGSPANPVAAAAESATSFAELATVLREPRFDAPATPAAPTTPAAPAASAEEPIARSEAVIEARPPDAAELPIDGYDELSVPSLRARLRTLDTGQLRVLVDYERAHAGRADVVALFERRIDKLNDDEA
jgi:hypothetical protein